MVAVATAFVAAAFAGGAGAALFVVFEPAEAEPGDVVTLRLAGTAQASKTATGEPIRVFLVPNYAVADVRSARDDRLTQVATIEPDASGRGTAAFEVPELAPGLYAAALECPECATTFSAVDAVEDVPPPYRGRIGLTVRKGESTAWWPFAAAAVVVAAVAFAIGRRRKGQFET